LSEKEAISLSDIFTTTFAVQPLPIELRHKEHCICLPSSANLVRDASVKNKSETNSVIEVIKSVNFLIFGFPYIKLSSLSHMWTSLRF
jgi:nardilysin